MQNDLVSIVIPVYNRESLIKHAIESALAQTYLNIEVVVVDNCSTDNTWAILTNLSNENKKIRIFQNISNIGPVRNWEKCFQYANGKYVKILWSDDLMKNNFIEETLNLFLPEVAFVMTGIEYIDEQGRIFSKSNFQSKESLSTVEYINDVIYKQEFQFPVSPCCAIFRREDLIKNLIVQIPNSNNLVFNNLGAGNDLLLFLLTAVQKKYTRIIIFNDCLVSYRTHKNSITTNTGKKIDIFYNWAIWFFIQKYYDSKSNKKKFKSLILLYILRFRADYKNIFLDIKEGIDFSFALKKFFSFIKSKFIK